MTSHTVLGRILMADDEETFLMSTAALLERAGYEVVTVTSGDAAAELVSRESFDVVVADIRMAGNSELQLVHLLSEMEDAPPVILLTGYPSLKTAVPAVHLAVAAYLIKPVDFDLLVRYIQIAVEHARANRLLRQMAARARDWQAGLGTLSAEGLRHARSRPGAAIEGFTNITLANISASLEDLRRVIVSTQGASPVEANPCLTMSCPRYAMLTAAVADTLNVIEETKKAFKSRALGELKDRLREVQARVE